MAILRAGAVGMGLALVLLTAAVRAEPSDELDTLIDDYWANELDEDPFLATHMGVNEHNDRVPSAAPEDEARRAGEAAAYFARLQTIDREALNEDERLNAQILDYILKHRAALAGYQAWRAPFSSDTGFHVALGYVVSSTPFRTEQDYRDYLDRLAVMPGYIDQNIDNMRDGLASGFTQPRVIMQGVLPSFGAQVKDNPSAHPLYKPFEKMPASISERRKRALRNEARTILQQDVIPAFARLYAFMKDEYAPKARETIAASALPNGKEYYAALVRYYTTLEDADPQKIHALGLREAARIRREMNTVIRQTGFKGDFAAFLDFLRSDPQFYAKSPDLLLARAAWIAKDIDGRLPGYFGKLPRQPYSVEPVPAELAPNYTTARYVGAAPGADRGGQFWVNTYNYEKRPLYQLTAMALHEAVPGHHLQIALALELEDAPAFRRDFYPHAFGEGWALYAEKLGVEMGVYQTPYDHFGRLTWEMWRACRLVIDTGIHAKGWTREQAVDYLASNTALSLHNVQTEVDRYISRPGQALAYKMGELKIWELRENAERKLGDDFDIREFHDVILAQGGLPLDILSARVDEYIADVKREIE